MDRVEKTRVFHCVCIMDAPVSLNDFERKRQQSILIRERMADAAWAKGAGVPITTMLEGSDGDEDEEI
jgi:hypothetical protein